MVATWGCKGHYATSTQKLVLLCRKPCILPIPTQWINQVQDIKCPHIASVGLIFKKKENIQHQNAKPSGIYNTYSIGLTWPFSQFRMRSHCNLDKYNILLQRATMHLTTYQNHSLFLLLKSPPPLLLQNTYSCVKHKNEGRDMITNPNNSWQLNVNKKMLWSEKI